MSGIFCISLKTQTGLEQEDMQMTEQLIEWLGRYGADADGGVTRLLYTRS
ncbi:hypothetical protein VQ056_26220 [Paenibacillus sp. JTLBN-2024]